jgi:hypothetical protein
MAGEIFFAMTVTQIFQWANQNQGVLALLAVLFGVGPLVYRGIRKAFPSKQEKRLKIQEEFAHAERMKKEVESRAQWDKVLHHYSVFLIRDVERRLPETEEVHSSVPGLYTTGVLTDIHTEHLEFTHGARGVKFIKNVAGTWQFADEKDDEAIKVDMVSWLNYRDILLIRWETDEYWEWPQICCRFTSANQFPFSRLFFAKRGTGLGNRPYYHGVCLVSDVFPKRPSGS